MALKFKLVMRKNLGEDHESIPEKVYAQMVYGDLVTFDEFAFVGLNKLSVIGRAADGNRVRLMNAYGCATVYGEIHLAGIIAVRADRDGLICAEQRAAVKERMRTDGREDYAFRFRVYPRAARRERVCRGARRCSQNEAVRAEFIKLGTVDGKAEIVNSGLCTGDDRVV